MGTIQPSRFLSHTGKILPGVRRVVTIPEPAVGVESAFIVPAGVQWWVLGGFFFVVTDAVVGNRVVTFTVNVDGLQVWQVASGVTQVASTTVQYSVQSSNAYTPITGSSSRSVIALPGAYLPQGAVVATSIAGFDAGDQISALNLWIEEVYVTDPQLSEIARTRAELDREIAAYEFQQAEQAQTGA